MKLFFIIFTGWKILYKQKYVRKLVLKESKNILVNKILKRISILFLIFIDYTYLFLVTI